MGMNEFRRVGMWLEEGTEKQIVTARIKLSEHSLIFSLAT